MVSDYTMYDNLSLYNVHILEIMPCLLVLVYYMYVLIDIIPNGKASAISRDDSKDSRSSSRPSPIPPSPNSMGTSPDNVTLDTLGIKVGDKVTIDGGTGKSKVRHW